MPTAAGRGSADPPLLVFGPRSTDYDFGPGHPLTPRRFGPGIDLLRAVGAEPGLAPEPASDDDLLACHTAAYLDVVRAFSADPFLPPMAGIGTGDDPAFPGMHEAAAAVAGGSIRALEAILAGRVRHAFHPGGGLHHAMPDRASGFCIYDDPALAIARARRDGLRVLYVDLDTHHGDGVQAIHAGDPGVLTVSFHESGRYLFPGTGFVAELGPGRAGGTSVNVPFEPYTGELAWLAAVERLVPELAAAFGPDVVVSQHGADAHAWDPLAHLRVTTTAMGAAARLVDAVAHRHAGGRWLATGGGGYDAYRVVPRSWSLVWLAGAHREPPDSIPPAWRDRWAADAARYGQAPPPTRFEDEPNAGLPLDPAQDAAEAAAARTVELVRRLVVPALLRAAADRGWWSPQAAGGEGDAGGTHAGSPAAAAGRRPELLELTPERTDRIRLESRVVAPADPAVATLIVRSAVAAGARGVAAVVDDAVVGLALAAASTLDPARDELLAVGVAPRFRGAGLAGALLARLVEATPAGRPIDALVTVAERDVVEPLDRDVRAIVGRRLLDRAGFRVRAATGSVGREDPGALAATFDRRTAGTEDG